MTDDKRFKWEVKIVGNVVDDCYFDVGVWCSKVVEIESDC